GHWVNDEAQDQEHRGGHQGVAEEISSPESQRLHALATPDRSRLIVLMRPPLRVGGACGPPPPVAAPLASSLRAPSRGDPPHDGPAAAGCPVYRCFGHAARATAEHRRPSSNSQRMCLEAARRERNGTWTP